MNKKLYDLMDFPEIEAVIYSEESNPRAILGPRKAAGGILIQAFVPGAEELKVWTADDDVLHKMELVDEAGFFAVLLKKKEIPYHEFVRKTSAGEVTIPDPYQFGPVLTEKDQKSFQAGNLKHAWEKLGAHPAEINGVRGVSFAVWAPDAIRVSAVGDWNAWDGRMHQMNRLPSGVFELFVPGVKPGMRYQFEIKLKGGMTYVKSDPFGLSFERKNGLVSVVPEQTRYQWNDDTWMREKKNQDVHKMPLMVCQMDFGSWCREHEVVPDFAEAAKDLAEDILKQGYTHILLSPVMEYPDDASEGFETAGYYALTSRYGTPDAFRKFVDLLHRNGIGVILDFVASYFAGGNSLLAAFDGTFLFEHMDPRRGIHPAFGTHIFNYGRPEVRNFLISAAMYWAEQFHVDGFRLTDVATMLYQDYGRNEGEWVANLYGGTENLEAVDFLQQMNTVLHREVPGMITIAEEMAGWNGLTAPVSRGGIGFDYKWNHWWAEDFLSYMHLDPLFRGAHQDDLTIGTVYAWSEHFLIGFGKDETVRAGGRFTAYMSGVEEEIRKANLRLAFAYIMTHPGSKLLNEAAAEELPEGYLQTLSAVLRDQPALYLDDEEAESFEWISNLDWERNLLIFLRKTEKKEDTLLVVCNFSNVTYEAFPVGVPFAGKYKEIFNSDAEAFGGSGAVNPRVKISRPAEQDERKDSIKVKVPPLGVSIYRFSEQVEKRADNRAAKKGKTA